MVNDNRWLEGRRKCIQMIRMRMIGVDVFLYRSAAEYSVLIGQK